MGRKLREDLKSTKISLVLEFLLLILLPLGANGARGTVGVGTALRNGGVPPMNHKMAKLWFGEQPFANQRPRQTRQFYLPDPDNVKYYPVASFQSKVTPNSNGGVRLYNQPFIRAMERLDSNSLTEGRAKDESENESNLQNDPHPKIVEKVATKSIARIPLYFEGIADFITFIRKYKLDGGDPKILDEFLQKFYEDLYSMTDNDYHQAKIQAQIGKVHRYPRQAEQLLLSEQPDDMKNDDATASPESEMDDEDTEDSSD